MFINDTTKEKIINIYNQYFKGDIDIINSDSLGIKSTYIDIYCKHCKNDLEKDNDTFYITLEIIKYNDNDYQFKKLKASYKTKATNKDFYCDFKNIIFREIRGDENNIIKAFKSFIDRLHKAIKIEIANNNLMEMIDIK